jgi:hypothetical protein
MKGFENLPIRFFIYDRAEDNWEVDIVEVNEADFLEAEGEVEYERDTVRENGCSQIRLTKRNGY